MKFKTSFFLLATSLCLSALAQTPVELANAQLEAYNNRDIDAFLVPYSDTVKVYDGDKKLLYQGKETMREQYAGMFAARPDLNCKLLNRIAVGNIVVEHEEVTFEKGRTGIYIVMYKVVDKKIQEVHFVN